jgi:hypothetical protein
LLDRQAFDCGKIVDRVPTNGKEECAILPGQTDVCVGSAGLADEYRKCKRAGQKPALHYGPRPGAD